MIKRKEHLQAKAQAEKMISEQLLEKILTHDKEIDQNENENENENEIKSPESSEFKLLAPQRERVLILCSRGIISRHRYLSKDIHALLPHSKKESKFDPRQPLKDIVETAELYSCTSCLFFEAKRNNDLYLWATKLPMGPSIRFHVENSYTTMELKLTGNCLKGSRPILLFDQSFDDTPLTKLYKEVLHQIFGVPKNTPRSKPFIDHIFSFFFQDNRIWFRNYQISEQKQKDLNDPNLEQLTNLMKTQLIEIGPRLVLRPIKVLASSFCGSVLFADEQFVPPSIKQHFVKKQNTVNALKRKEMKKHLQRRKEKIVRGENNENELDTVFNE